MKTSGMIDNTAQAPEFAPIKEKVRLAISHIAESDCPVLIEGEYGVGKRSIAAQIHALSQRSRGLYQQVDSGDLDKQSLITAMSMDGTLHMLEISTLPIELQRLFVDSYLRPDHPVKCRLVCSSSCDLIEKVKACEMSEDFYYLISTITLRVAPLRCRRSEILPLADELLTRYSRQFDRPKPVLCKEVTDFLMDHSWPDNLPGLHTAIKTFVAIGDQAISFAALRARAPMHRAVDNIPRLSLKEASRAATARIEQHLISEVLIATGGNRKRAAAQLGISYKALLYKLKQFDPSTRPLRRSGVLL
jgi:DNA-binding NtrC family response regulator